MPIKYEPMIMCPVEETGRNSVRPSMMARMIAWNEDMVIGDQRSEGRWRIAKNLDNEACHCDHGARVRPRNPKPCGCESRDITVNPTTSTTSPMIIS